MMLQVFYNTNMFITPVNTPGTYLIVHNPESNFLRVCNIQNQGDHMDIVIPWLELDQAELRGYSIDGWLLFSYRQHIIYYDVVNRRNHILQNVPWELADHIGVFSSSPLEYGNITIFAEHSEDDEMEVLLHTEERGWRRYVVPADMATNIRVCGLVLHEGKLLCLDTSGQVHIFHLDRLGEYVSSIALLPDHFDADGQELYFASLVVDVAAVYVIILLENDMDEVGIKWFELTQRDGEYILESVFDAGEHFAYAVGNRNGYRFNPSFDIGRRGSLLAGSLKTDIDCIWIDNVIPPEWETFKECSEEDCPCSCAFVRVGAHQF